MDEISTSSPEEVALAAFVIDLSAVLESCMSAAMLLNILIFLLFMALSSDADFVGLNDKWCCPIPSAASKFLFSVFHRWHVFF